MFRFSRCDKGEVDVYRFMSTIVQITIIYNHLNSTVHTYPKCSDSKISTLESGLRKFRICLQIRRMRVDDSRIGKEKVAD